MKYLLDTHTHTIVSGHAYSTILENVKAAQEKGLEMMAITDHGVAMPGSPHIYYFYNLKVIPRVIYGVTVLKGIEANIIDFSGKLDMEDEVLGRLDLVIASLHDNCIEPGTREENTRALMGAMDNEYVDILGHTGNPAFEIDIDAVVSKAKEKDILIEINNSSFVSSRIGSYSNCRRIAEKAKEIGARIVLGSDAHMCFSIGNFDKADEIIRDINFPEELIMNTSPERLKQYLKNKGKLSDLK
jgi:Histidinol phosphatase and related hydrolases of the PHP family